jgi:Fungal specific transcription factor domain/Fungal Zn(2)-Cys(6) binuclear cluster domain
MLTTSTAAALASGNSGATKSLENQLAARHRQKRSQVARACDGCRINRTKCDNNHPCSNCKNKGRQCNNSSANKVATLSQAYEEIGRLRQKVQELEEKLRREHEQTPNIDPQLLTPPSLSPAQVSQSESIEHGDSKKTFWEGIQLRPARSPHETWFGQSSLYYFIKRLSICLSSSFQEPYLADHMLFNSASSGKLLDGPTAVCEDDLSHHVTPSAQDANMTGADLSPTQEEYFISLFWQSYHTSLFAILDEAEFKEHYQSLWTQSGNDRKSSALVDIVLAMCMQYAISTLSADNQGNIAGNKDSTIAGRWHYRRCQTLLTYELESPTISTLQCHLLCAIYLCGGSFHNMVDSSCGLAVRTAYMLGLHLDPPKTMSLREQEKRRRLWWAVYVLDSKTNMKLGRPFLLNNSHATPHLPSDNLEAAMLSGSTFAPLGDNVTWLSFNLHQTKLFIVIRAAHTAFYDRSFDLGDNQTIWDDPQVLEDCSETLHPYKKYLEEWVKDVPNALKTNRQYDGRPFSTDRSALEIEQFAPLWLQRQRLLLELMYHHLCTSLYRPFISLFSNPAPGPLAEENAMRCSAHAIALTKIAHQVLSSTSILDGWHEVFQCQWKYVICRFTPFFFLVQKLHISSASLTLNLQRGYDSCGLRSYISTGSVDTGG